MYPPQGNQQPTQPPYGVPPAGYVYPGQRQQSKGGCWLWGGIGCLAILIVFAILAGIGYYSVTHGPGNIASVMQNAKNTGQTTAQASQISEALKRYNTDNGHYPASLTDLIPKYLAGMHTLHAPTDPDTDPNHVSFDYHQPAPGAPGSTIILSYDTAMDINFGGVKQHMVTTTSFKIDGSIASDITTTMTMPNGKTTTSTTHTDSGSSSTP